MALNCCVRPLATLGLPGDTAIETSATFFRLNEVPTATPRAVAVTMYAPPVVLAVAVTEAEPRAIVAEAADRAADAPEAGAANVTTLPLTGSFALLGLAILASRRRNRGRQ